jgi:cytochrome c2
MLIAGCQQSPPVAAKAAVTPAPSAAAAAPLATVVPTIDPARLASAKELLVSLGCVGCHTIDTIPAAIGIIGPNLTHVSTRAAATIASQGYKSAGKASTVREYLKESILSPSAFVSLECSTGPCPDFVMPRDFKTRIKAEDLEAILDLLATLK